MLVSRGAVRKADRQELLHSGESLMNIYFSYILQPHKDNWAQVPLSVRGVIKQCMEIKITQEFQSLSVHELTPSPVRSI